MQNAVFNFYGYFLKGTGSAIYARELTKALNKEGKNVVLFSQEEDVLEFDFIAGAFIVDLKKKQLKKVFHERSTPYPGKTIHVKLDTNGFLPVYVYDTYPGYKKVKEFSRITDYELEKYKKDLTSSLELFLSEVKIAPESVIYHHLFPLPYVFGEMLSKYQVVQASVFHGSDLNFAIKKSNLASKCFFASLDRLDFIIALTDAGKKDLESYLSGKKLKKIAVVSPGIDFDLFYLRKNKQEAFFEFSNLYSSFKVDRKAQRIRSELLKSLSSLSDFSSLKDVFSEIEKLEALKMPEEGLPEKIHSLIDKPLIVFAGKYLWTKGAQALLLSMPFVWKENEDAHLLLVGFGGSRGFLEKLRWALGNSNFNEVLKLLTSHEDIDPGSRKEVLLDASSSFAQKLLEPEFLNSYKNLTDFKKFFNQVIFCGYLDHARLAPLLNLGDVFVAPSIFKESFGLVLIEASACGLVPVGSCHSGFKDTLLKIAEETGINPGTICVPLDDNFVENLAGSTIKALNLVKNNPEVRQSFFSWARNNFSWEKAAKDLSQLLQKKTV